MAAVELCNLNFFKYRLLLSFAFLYAIFYYHLVITYLNSRVFWMQILVHYDLNLGSAITSADFLARFVLRNGNQTFNQQEIFALMYTRYFD